MIKLYYGDCLNIIPALPDKSVDMILCDLPYGIDYLEWDVLHNNKNSSLGRQNKNMKQKGYKRTGKPINGWSKEDRNIGNEYKKMLDKWFIPLYKKCKEGSPVLLFASRRFQHKVSQSLEDSGFIIKDVLIWKKNKCHAKAQRISNIIKKRGMEINSSFDNYRIGNLKPFYEPIIYAFKPYSKTITDCFIKDKIGGFNCVNGIFPSNILEFDVSNNKYHETEKPVDSLEFLIQTFSFEKQTILDFTMGSGSTGVACINTKRNFIGIEKEETYFQIAEKRIKEAEKNFQEKLF